jgi:hypothetical protein
MYIGEQMNIAVMDESDYGDYVHYPDYAKLETELRDTRRALELLLQGILEDEDAGHGVTPENIERGVELSVADARNERTANDSL